MLGNKIKSRLRVRFILWLAQRGYRIKRLGDEDKRYLLGSNNESIPLPDGAMEALDGCPEELQRLRKAYAALDVPATRHSLWDENRLSGDLQLPWFRGDNVYVFQYRRLRSEARVKEYLSLLDVRGKDRLGLFNVLDEDGLFGCWVFDFPGYKHVSRDLLDSINEINFLDKHIGLSAIGNARVLDIGAGYGRLAHRMCTALDNIAAYDCVDAIPESTFLCDYYLNYRGVGNARSVPLHELDTLHDRYDVAVNIHSFSECTQETVRWWLEQVARREIPWLLIIPNESDRLLSIEPDSSRRDFMADVEAAGYKLQIKEPVYADDGLREMIGVDDHFLLFKRESSTS